MYYLFYINRFFIIILNITSKLYILYLIKLNNNIINYVAFNRFK